MQLRTLFAVTAAAVALAPLAHASEIDGKWDVVYQTDDGTRTSNLTVATDGEAVKAVMGETELAGTYTDGQLSLTGEHYAGEAGYTATVSLEGRLEDGKLKGNWRWSEYASTFEATRSAEQP